MLVDLRFVFADQLTWQQSLLVLTLAEMVAQAGD
jgi:hypothetical protein